MIICNYSILNEKKPHRKGAKTPRKDKPFFAFPLRLCGKDFQMG